MIWDSPVRVTGMGALSPWLIYTCVCVLARRKEADGRTLPSVVVSLRKWLQWKAQSYHRRNTFCTVFKEVVNSFSLLVCEESHFLLENHKHGYVITSFPLLSDEFDLICIVLHAQVKQMLSIKEMLSLSCTIPKLLSI